MEERQRPNYTKLRGGKLVSSYTPRSSINPVITNTPAKPKAQKSPRKPGQAVRRAYKRKLALTVQGFQTVQKSIGKINWRQRYFLPLLALVIIVILGSLRAILVAKKPFATNTQSAQQTGPPASPPNSDTSPNDIGEGTANSKPDFTVLMPQSATKDKLKSVTRKTPDGSVVYSYEDKLSGTKIEVTQQQLPSEFASAPQIELEKIAKSFQATSVIQIDGQNVYHGLNEKTGIQLLVAIKSNLLVFIRSDKKLPDEAWVGYITSLK